jgi:hypothetical protein
MLLPQLFGTIDNPLKKLGSSYGDVTETTGPVFFLSNVIRLITVGAGIFAFINLIISGIDYIGSSGNKEVTGRAIQRINMSLIGLVLIVGANALAAILGMLLFGEWDAILNPKIYGPGT